MRPVPVTDSETLPTLQSDDEDLGDLRLEVIPGDGTITGNLLAQEIETHLSAHQHNSLYNSRGMSSLLHGDRQDKFHLQELKNITNKASLTERGAIYTKSDVVNFMIDLALGGDDPAFSTFLEPSFGTGNILIPLVERIVSRQQWDNAQDIQDAIRAYELSHDDYINTRQRVKQVLAKAGFSELATEYLLGKWLINADFLLSEPNTNFSHAIGNPPYLRIERVPPKLLSIYRQKFATLHDRADIYVAFFEHCLGHLADQGNLTFICTDRWMKSKYGEKLRGLVTEKFSLSYYLDLYATSPFETEVATYPAIVSISNAREGVTKFASEPIQNINELNHYLPFCKHPKLATTKLPGSRSPIILSIDPSLRLLRKIEEMHPRIEDIGCSVSIGIATGADRVFVRKRHEANVEEKVLIPLIKGKDINSGTIQWSGNYLINPYEADGSLRELSEYPLLKSYLESHKALLSGRHCVKRQPLKWYRTIDKFHQNLTSDSKLLVPDIRTSPKVVLEKGMYYPHHNLYHITSKLLCLNTLMSVLNGGIMKLFVVNYSTPMQGGCYRFQAQHLRKICIPMKIFNHKQDIGDNLINEVLIDIYDLNANEIDILKSI